MDAHGTADQSASDSTSSSARPNWRRRFIACFLTLLAGITVSVTVGQGSASAMAAPQKTSVGTAKVLYSDINQFWTISMKNWGWGAYYQRPVVHFYNKATVQCATHLAVNNSFACGGRYLGNIWFGTGWTQTLLKRFGDYGPGVVLAHEWGHEIMYDLKWTSHTGTKGSELFADCLAGMYTHYGLLVSHKLDNSDYWEGYRTLAAIAGGDHGTAKQRTDWYEYGYAYYNIYSCARALG